MPLPLACVEPVYVSRAPLPETCRDNEREFIYNETLCGLLRQLSSLTVIATEIFDAVKEEYQKIEDRISNLRSNIGRVREKVRAYNPKEVPVREFHTFLLTFFGLRSFSNMSTWNRFLFQR